jgi:hypothetical protein
MRCAAAADSSSSPGPRDSGPVPFVYSPTDQNATITPRKKETTHSLSSISLPLPLCLASRSNCQSSPTSLHPALAKVSTPFFSSSFPSSPFPASLSSVPSRGTTAWRGQRSGVPTYPAQAWPRRVGPTHPRPACLATGRAHAATLPCSPLVVSLRPKQILPAPSPAPTPAFPAASDQRAPS